MIIRMIGANIQLFFYIRKEQSKKRDKKRAAPQEEAAPFPKKTIESLFIPPNARIETVATSHTAHSLFIVGGVNLIF